MMPTLTLPRLLIAAPSSGSGKTTITVGLLAALRARGRRVAPFKVGPDYIDPGYLNLSGAARCRNLDAWLLSPETLRGVFARAVSGSDLALIEGMMGLFDGVAGDDDSGSAAHVARLLHTPVVLVLDVSAMARSAAAVVAGFQKFDAQVHLVGVILNRVGGAAHAQLCAQAIEGATGVSVLGYLPHDPALHLPERHLGLVPAAEAPEVERVLERLVTQMEATVNLDALIALAQAAPPLEESHRAEVALPKAASLPRVRVAVSRDAAFSFTYEDNLFALEAAGAEVVPFSPLSDSTLPPNIGALILSGGFPEMYAEVLSNNRTMLEDLRAAQAAGLPIIAECGGLMALTEAIVDLKGRAWPMAGLLPGLCAMSPRLHLGYRQARAASNGPLLQKGETIRAHEFHYSVWQGRPVDLPYAYEIELPDGSRQGEGAALGNLWASYLHLHFLSKPEMVERLLAIAITRPTSDVRSPKSVGF